MNNQPNEYVFIHNDNMLRYACQGRTVKLYGFYFCFGEYDGVALSEATAITTATAVVMAVACAGHLKAIKTTRLFTVEETMEAMRKAGSFTFGVSLLHTSILRIPYER